MDRVLLRRWQISVQSPTWRLDVDKRLQSVAEIHQLGNYCKRLHLRVFRVFAQLQQDQILTINHLHSFPNQMQSLQRSWSPGINISWDRIPIFYNVGIPYFSSIVKVLHMIYCSQILYDLFLYAHSNICFLSPILSINI